MWVSHLSLRDFRNYHAADLQFDPGVSVLVGRNGQGKTNLIEALYYTAALASHRVATDAPLIRAGTQRAIVRTRVVREDRASTVELEITAGRANRVRINRGQPTRTRAALGLLRAVLFSPEDLALVAGGPEARRRFLDQLLVQLLPRAGGVLAEYERVVRQRSALLKSGQVADTLALWDARLVDLGATIMYWRSGLIAALEQPTGQAYEQVAETSGAVRVAYEPQLNPAIRHATEAEYQGLLTEQLDHRRRAELARGQTLVGPHRDELALTLNGLPARGYASHGETWSLALALRLATWRVLCGDIAADGPFWVPTPAVDGDPLLLLDDVFAELDERRRTQLAELVMPARQVLITTATPEGVPASLQARRFQVVAGEVLDE